MDWYMFVVLSLLHCTPVQLYGSTQEKSFPSPVTDFLRCGMLQPGWVCDPDGLINSAEAKSINAELSRIHSLSDVCLCRLCPSSVGLGVAFVRKIQFEYENTKKTYAEQKKSALFSFASYQRIHKWLFLKGECYNNAIIVITGDGEVEFQVGRNAYYKIGWDCQNEIESVGQKYVSAGKYYEGALEMAKKLRSVLETGDKCKKDYSGSSSSVSYVPFVIAIGVLIAVVLLCITVVRLRRNCAMRAQQPQGGATYHTSQGTQVVVGQPPPSRVGMSHAPHPHNPGTTGMPPAPPSGNPWQQGVPPQAYNPGGVSAPPPPYPVYSPGGQVVHGQPPPSYNPGYSSTKEYGQF